MKKRKTGKSQTYSESSTDSGKRGQEDARRIYKEHIDLMNALKNK